MAVLMGWFGLPRFRIESAIHHSPDGGIRVNITDAPERHDNAPTSLFVTWEDELARTRIHDAVGLLSAVESMVIALEHVEDYALTFTDGELRPVSSPLVDQLWWDALDVGADARARWSRAASAVAAHPDAERIRLSLRWYDDAKRDSGVDAFVKMWFALETLSGATRRDKVPNLLRDGLAVAYSLSKQEAGNLFGIGRVYGLRKLIVHQGQRIEISRRLLLYLGGMYVDLLVVLLGFAVPGWAQLRLQESGGITNLLPSSVGGRSEAADAELAEAEMERLRSYAVRVDTDDGDPGHQAPE